MYDIIIRLEKLREADQRYVYPVMLWFKLSPQGRMRLYCAAYDEPLSTAARLQYPHRDIKSLRDEIAAAYLYWGMEDGVHALQTAEEMHRNQND